MDDAARHLLAQSISVAALGAARADDAHLVARGAHPRRCAADLGVSEESGLRRPVPFTLQSDS